MFAFSFLFYEYKSRVIPTEIIVPREFLWTL